MKTRWHLISFVATFAVLAVFAADVVADVDWSEGTLPGLRLLVLAASALLAGLYYWHWESVKVRAPATHAAAALGLLGGALLVASVFGSGRGEAVFRGTVMAAAGMAAVALAHFLGRLSIFAQEDNA
ncbi:MAG: hypothetical protein ABIN55_11945 [Aeromicrobium sp.]